MENTEREHHPLSIEGMARESYRADMMKRLIELWELEDEDDLSPIGHENLHRAYLLAASYLETECWPLDPYIRPGIEGMEQ